jgi:hypothetical protein
VGGPAKLVLPVFNTPTPSASVEDKGDPSGLFGFSLSDASLDLFEGDEFLCPSTPYHSGFEELGSDGFCAIEPTFFS